VPKILSQKFLEKNFFKKGVPLDKGLKIPRKISFTPSYPHIWYGYGGVYKGGNGGRGT